MLISYDLDKYLTICDENDNIKILKTSKTNKDGFNSDWSLKYIIYERTSSKGPWIERIMYKFYGESEEKLSSTGADISNTEETTGYMYSGSNNTRTTKGRFNN